MRLSRKIKQACFSTFDFHYLCNLIGNKVKKKRSGGSSPKHKSGHVVALLVLAVVFLFLLTQLPVLEWGGFSTKPVDLFSDIRVDEQSLDLPGDAVWQDTESDSLFFSHEEATDSITVSTDSVTGDTLTPPRPAVSAPARLDTTMVGGPPRRDGDVVLFEDFSPGEEGLSHLLAAMEQRLTLGRPVRIAFLGDSFIEADIFTQDVRSRLQSQYGGCGVGYVSMHSDFPGFRRSVVQSGSGWEVHSVLKPREADWSLMTLQQQYFVPLEGAAAQYRGTTRIERADSWTLSRFLFVARNDCSVSLKVGDGEWQTFAVTGSPEIQSLEVAGKTNRFQVKTGAIAGFTAIGVWLDDTQGIAIDNISTRGYSGLSLVSLPAARCAQMQAIVPYDAIVLQYGLNVMSPEILHYEAYARKMVAVVNHLKACYPNTDIILMGVGDRSRKMNGSFVTMPAVLALSHAQRLAAKNAGVVFWDTFAAMGGENGMVDYVAKKQANKDYTHINHKGGRRLAGEFVKSLEYSLNRYGQ